VYVANSRAAACEPDWKIDRVEKCRRPVEPANPGPIHAWLYSADPGPPIHTWLDAPGNQARLRGWILCRRDTALVEGGEFVRSACGTRLRVIYRRSFDATEANACPECVSMAGLWQTDRAEYDRQVKERHERWTESDVQRYEAIDAEDLARQERYGTDPIEDDDNELP
jgi:hypothetical protein